MYPDDITPLTYFPMFFDATPYWRALLPADDAVLRTTGLTLERVFSCLYALSTVLYIDSQLYQDTRGSLGAWGFAYYSTDVLIDRMTKAMRGPRTDLIADDVRRSVKVFLRVFSAARRNSTTEFESSRIHRYMSSAVLFVLTNEGRGVLVDLCGLPSGLAAWAQSIIADSRAPESRGTRFEAWVRAQLVEKFGSTCASSEPIIVRRVDGTQLTDIDAFVRREGTAFLISCKCRQWGDRCFRAECSQVHNRWTQVAADLQEWDDKWREFFSSSGWRERNPVLAGWLSECRLAVGLVVTLWPEWQPTLDGQFVFFANDREGRRSLWTRILTVDELLQFVGNISTNARFSIGHRI
jgi:hypothetical protein